MRKSPDGSGGSCGSVASEGSWITLEGLGWIDGGMARWMNRWMDGNSPMFYRTLSPSGLL